MPSHFKTYINCYASLFNDIPLCKHWLEHDIDVEDAEPIQQHIYRMSPNKCLHLNAKIQYMLDHDIARASFSSWTGGFLLSHIVKVTPYTIYFLKNA